MRSKGAGSAAAAAVIAKKNQSNDDDPDHAVVTVEEIAKAIHEIVLLHTDSGIAVRAFASGSVDSHYHSMRRRFFW